MWMARRGVNITSLRGTASHELASNLPVDILAKYQVSKLNLIVNLPHSRHYYLHLPGVLTRLLLPWKLNNGGSLYNAPKVWENSESVKINF